MATMTSRTRRLRALFLVSAALHGGALMVGTPTTVRNTRAVLCACAAPAEDPGEAARRDLESLERCLTLANLESQAEAAEESNDLAGAIECYEALLELQPPDAPNLREEDAARRALQQLLLESARRELEACSSEEGCELEHARWVPSEMAASFIKSELQRAKGMGEEARNSLAMRALDDVRKVRNSVVRLLQLSEEQAAADADRAKGEQAYLRLVENQPGWVAGWQLEEATRRRDDARLLRKSVEADLNRLELQLVRAIRAPCLAPCATTQFALCPL